MRINYVQIGLAVSFFLCVIYEAGAIKCYDCSTYYDNQKWCDDNHFTLMASKKIVDCDVVEVDKTRSDKPNACIKVVQIHRRIVKGTWTSYTQISNITTRGCGYLSGEAGCDYLLGAQGYGYTPAPPGNCHVHIQDCISDHPQYKLLREQGLESESDCRVAVAVYLDLIEVHGWWGTQLDYHQDKGCVVIRGFPSKGESQQYILPVSSQHPFTAESIHQALDIVQEKYTASSVTLGICDQDLTVVYHRISDGLVPPAPPQEMEANKRRRERKFQRRVQQHGNVNKLLSHLEHGEKKD